MNSEGSAIIVDSGATATAADTKTPVAGEFSSAPYQEGLKQ